MELILKIKKLYLKPVILMIKLYVFELNHSAEVELKIILPLNDGAVNPMQIVTLDIPKGQTYANKRETPI